MSRALEFLLSFALLALSGASSAQTNTRPQLLLLISEAKPGIWITSQRCVLVFPDRHFHLERATNNRGRDVSRKIYEGELSNPEWDDLSKILNTNDFRELAVPRLASSPVIEDLHLIAISIWRDGKFQNMEFLDERSRSPYDATLKPLLRWWKYFSSRKLPESKESPNKQCALEGALGDSVFAH
jgi:hypothetical protein